MQQLVVLDRDGVINEDSDAYVKSASEWVPIPGSISAISRLSQAGFRIAIVTNQSGLAKGLFDRSTLNAMHAKLRELVSASGGRIEMILFCPHNPADHCTCRKPEVDLFRQLAVRAGVDLRGIPFVGDSIGDLRAAKRLGLQPILVRTGKGERTAALGGLETQGIVVTRDLASAIDKIIRERN